MKSRRVAVSAISIVVLGSIGVWANEYWRMAVERNSQETARLASSETGVVRVISQNSFEITWTKLIDANRSEYCIEDNRGGGPRRERKEDRSAVEAHKAGHFWEPAIGHANDAGLSDPISD